MTSSATYRIPCNHKDFSLDLTLESGQVFRWQRGSDRWWIGAIEPEGYLVRIRQTDDALQIESANKRAVDRVRSYFRLDDPLHQYVEQWMREGGPQIASAVASYPGLRLIRQDPWECLISFLASPASPIYRIRRSMQKLCIALGRPCGSLGEVGLYRFPDAEILANTPRSVFDEAGLGFRGPTMAAVAAVVCAKGGSKWVRSLRQTEYALAKAELTTLPGVGEKIADCVCLFSLDKDDAVPIDVHIARISRTLFQNIPASLTPRAYGIVAREFRERFGAAAGWAQQYLYYSQIEKQGIWDDELGKHRKANH